MRPCNVYRSGAGQYLGLLSSIAYISSSAVTNINVIVMGDSAGTGPCLRAIRRARRRAGTPLVRGWTPSMRFGMNDVIEFEWGIHFDGVDQQFNADMQGTEISLTRITHIDKNSLVANSGRPKLCTTRLRSEFFEDLRDCLNHALHTFGP